MAGKGVQIKTHRVWSNFFLWGLFQFQRAELGGREAERNLQWFFIAQVTEIGIQGL